MTFQTWPHFDSLLKYHWHNQKNNIEFKPVMPRPRKRSPRQALQSFGWGQARGVWVKCRVKQLEDARGTKLHMEPSCFYLQYLLPILFLR